MLGWKKNDSIELSRMRFGKTFFSRGKLSRNYVSENFEAIAGRFNSYERVTHIFWFLDNVRFMLRPVYYGTHEALVAATC